MITQNQIKRTLSTPANIETIRQLLANEDIRHRTDVAIRACKQFNFTDARGQLQVSSCANALRELEKAGHIILPGVSMSSIKRTIAEVDMYTNAVAEPLARQIQPIPSPIHPRRTRFQALDAQLSASSQ